MVDAVLAETGAEQVRVRALPSRVVIYLLLAAALFGECGYRQVWARLVAGLDGLAVARPSAAGGGAAPRGGDPGAGAGGAGGPGGRRPAGPPPPPGNPPPPPPPGGGVGPPPG